MRRDRNAARPESETVSMNRVVASSSLASPASAMYASRMSSS